MRTALALSFVIGASHARAADFVVAVEPGFLPESLAIEGFVKARKLRLAREAYVVTMADGFTTEAVIAGFQNLSGVRYAHSDAPLRVNVRNDPYYSLQWHLENRGERGGTAGADIEVATAWEVTKGSADVTIAVLDMGFEAAHPDLQTSWRMNPGEIPGNQIDDDRNGYVDDVLGWSFVTNSPNVDGYYADHGTAVAGLVAAASNGIGVEGVCPACKVVPITVSATPSKDAEAFHYATMRGARIMTSSWGYPLDGSSTRVVEEAVKDATDAGAVVLFAMNNINQDDCNGRNPDISSIPGVFAVSGASDQDVKVVSSAWGACMAVLGPTQERSRQGITTVDLVGGRGFNPRSDRSQTLHQDYTTAFGGTSAATPIVAGVFGLIASANPDLTAEEMKNLVKRTADKINPAAAAYDSETGFSQKYGYGRVNAGRAVRAAAGLITDVP